MIELKTQGFHVLKFLSATSLVENILFDDSKKFLIKNTT